MATPQTACGTLAFEITGYQLHKGLGAGKCIRSASIKVGGFNWCLNYYPDGDNRKDSQGFIAVYLELLSNNAEARVAFHMRLINTTTKSSSTIIHVQDPVDYCTVDGRTNSNCTWGVSSNCKMLNMSELEKSPYLRNDSLLLECDITVFREPQVVRRTVTKVPIVKPLEPLRNLTHDLAMLLETKDGADVFFDVQGQVFPAHTIVLAMRSPVFKAQFHGPMSKQKHGGQSHVTVEDIEPEVFKALLRFLYTDSTRLDMKGLTRDERKEFTMHLLVAADRYDIEKLKFDCETFLCKSLEVANAATMLLLADQHNCIMLKDACIEFISCPDNRMHVVASEAYSLIKESCADVLEELFGLTE